MQLQPPAAHPHMSQAHRASVGCTASSHCVASKIHQHLSTTGRCPDIQQSAHTWTMMRMAFPAPQLAHIAVHARHDVGDRLAHGDQHPQQLLRAVPMHTSHTAVRSMCAPPSEPGHPLSCIMAGGRMRIHWAGCTANSRKAHDGTAARDLQPRRPFLHGMLHGPPASMSSIRGLL